MNIIDAATYSGYGNAVTMEIERLQTKLAAAEQRCDDLQVEIRLNRETIAAQAVALRVKDEALQREAFWHHSRSFELGSEEHAILMKTEHALLTHSRKSMRELK